MRFLASMLLAGFMVVGVSGCYIPDSPLTASQPVAGKQVPKSRKVGGLVRPPGGGNGESPVVVPIPAKPVSANQANLQP